MNNEHLFTAKRIAKRLFALEDMIDATLAEAMTFGAELPRARASMKMPGVMGQPAVDAASGIIAALTEARRQMVKLHEGLDETRGQLGFQTLAFGSIMPKPSSPTGLGRETIAA